MIRPADRRELPEIYRLIESAFRGDSAKAGWSHEADLLGGQRTDMAALEEIMADPDQHLWVAEEHGALVGCQVISRTPAGNGYLGMLTVAPTLQARGLGRQLVAAAEDCARGFGAEALEMTVVRQRPELIAWYERRGYSLTGERRPFPLDDPRYGLPKTRDLEFVVMAKAL